MRSSLKPWVVALSLALAAQVAPAAGFGKINVNSALGQPLSAEIDLLNVSPDDLVGMQVRLATPEAFREANVEFSSVLASVHFSIEKRSNGQSYIKVTSAQPISEPALNLLVEVTWPSGRLLRDYPVLLNPAGYAQDRAVAETGQRLPPAPPEIPVKAPPVADSRPPAANPTPAPAPAQAAAAPPAAAKPARAAATGKNETPAKPEATAKAEPAPRPESAPAPAASVAPGSDYTIKPGDTVRALAAVNKPGSASLEQTMLAMFEANRSVFINDSIHRIRAGKHMHLPTESEASAVPADEASRRVNLLATDFEAYRKRVADAAGARPDTTGAGKGPVTGKLSAQTEDAARPAKPGGSDVVQVSRSATGTGKVADNGLAQRRTAADDKANKLEEEAIARENQLREARERVALLESNLAKMRALVKKGDADPASATAPAPTPEAALKPPVSAPEAIKPLAPPVDQPKPAEPVVTAAKPPAETSFVDDLMAQLSGNPLAVGGGILSGLVVAWLGLNAVRRRRDRTQELFAPTTSSPEPITVDAVTTDKGSALVDTNTGAYASEFERVVPDQQVDEVDPVAEADVYIAYGRDVQAEEILKEAMVKDPDRTEILMKLLEIYAQRKSVEEYSQHALQLRERVGTSHPLWSAAMAMGYEIDPENPLYQGAGEDFVPPVHTPSAPATLDLDLSEPGGAAPAPAIHLGDPLPGFLPDLSLEPVHEAPGALQPAVLEIGEPEPHAAAPEHGDPHETPEHGGEPRAEHAAAQADPEADAEAAETLRALSAISADSLRSVEAPRHDTGPGGWPSLPEIAAFGGGLSLAASNEPGKSPEGDPFTLDFDLGEAGSKSSGASMAHGNAALDLGKIDLDLEAEPQASSPPVLTLVSNPAPLPPVPGESAAPAHSFADINLDLAQPEAAAAVATAAPAAAAEAVTAVEQSSQWHNVATKLDLARAYLEIGDKDGAREILREVSQEGDEAQRQEAERLAVQI